MENKIEEMTILQLMDSLSEKAYDSKLSDEFWAENGCYADELGKRLSLTPLQTVLLSLCLRKGPRRVDFDDIASFLDISKIKALTFSDEFNALIRIKYLKYHDAKDEDEFDIPVPVVRSLKNNEKPEQPKRAGLSSAELFDLLNDLFGDLASDFILPRDLLEELKDLFNLNKDLSFVQELNALKLERDIDMMALVALCNFLVNDDDDEITYGQIESIYRSRGQFVEEKSAFKDGSHNLMKAGLVEHVCEDGQANTARIHLSSRAKSLLLADFHLRGTENKVGGLLSPETLTEKQLFYTAKNAPQVDELFSFLQPDRYFEIRRRMKENGFRSGFACLFYGSPGTGKTETVYQLARQTGRNIMVVNIRDIKSMWVGESEKNMQEVFDRYRLAVQRSEQAPILLFNEADGILGIRQEGAQKAVDKMENSIQNIILQEMEKLDGILIATTNLTQNLDPAFERRFLYKICFEKPDATVREKIWHTMLPSLSEEQCSALASAYELSGGQMENVARKYSINSILYGTEKSPMDILHAYCAAERLDSAQPTRRIGF